MNFPVQLLRLTKTNGGEAWVNPAQIVFAEIGKVPEKDRKDKTKDEFLTILHMTGKEGKVFVLESPAKINEIVRKTSIGFELNIKGK